MLHNCRPYLVFFALNSGQTFIQLNATITATIRQIHQHKAPWRPPLFGCSSGPDSRYRPPWQRDNTTAIVTSSDASPAPRRAALEPWRPCPALLLPRPALSLSLMLSGLKPHTPPHQNKHHHHHCTSSVLLTCTLFPRPPAPPQLHIGEPEQQWRPGRSCVGMGVCVCVQRERASVC